MPRIRTMPRPDAKEGKRVVHPVGYAEMRLQQKQTSRNQPDTSLVTIITATRSFRQLKADNT